MRHEYPRLRDDPGPHNEPGYGLMSDLNDLAKHAAQIADRLDQLRDRLAPILMPGPVPAAVDDVADASPAQQRVRTVAITLRSIDDAIEDLLEGIQL